MLKTRLLAVWFGLLVVAPAGQVFADPSAEPASQPAGASYTPVAFLQTVTVDAGGHSETNGVPKDFRIGSIEIIGDYLYAAGEPSAHNIHYLKRNQDGTLVYCGAAPALKDHRPELCAAGGRLYALLANYADYSMACYDIDSATGKPEQKGTNIPIKCDWAGSLIADREGKNLYLWAGGKLLWFKIGDDGKPESAGEVTGNGFVPRSLRMAPDEKHLYCIDSGSYSIVCVERKPDGSISLKKKISLEQMDKGRDKTPGGSLHISPDGNWVYAALWRDVNPGCSFGIFKRDSETGDLTLGEAGSGNDGTRSDFKLSNLRALNMVFLPDGTAGYVGTNSGCLLQTFRCDPKTGHISDVMDITVLDARQFSSAAILLDSKKGVLYGTGGAWPAPGGVWALKAQQPPASGSRSEIQTPSVGTQATSGPAAALDWPRYLGANCDSKSLLKGIRKDWTGGLRKVWSVKGLSPGTATFSSPVVKGDKLVVLGRHGGVDQLFCFNADTGGKPLWIVEYATNDGGDYGYGDGPQSTPTIDGDKVYFASRQGNFVCASMTDGKILWRKAIGCGGHGYASSPLVWDDLVFIQMSDGKALSACNKNTGEKVWTFGGAPGGCASLLRATIGGKEQVVFYDAGKHVCGLDHATGLELWGVDVDLKGEMFPWSSPVVHDNCVYVPYSHSPAAVRIEDGKAKVLWNKGPKDEGYYVPGFSEAIEMDGYLYAFVNGAAFGVCKGGDMRCIDLKNGQTKWNEKGTDCGTVTVVDGCLLCLTWPGDLFLMQPSPDGFKKIAEMKGVLKRGTPWVHHGIPRQDKGQIPCWTLPVVARGKVYLRLSDELLCYDLMK